MRSDTRARASRSRRSPRRRRRATAGSTATSPNGRRCTADLELGDVLVQEPLARLIELLAADGPDAYYRGPVAEAVAAAVGRYGGFMTTEDLAAHAGRWDAPLRRRRTATSRSRSSRRPRRAPRCSRSCGSSTASTSAAMDAGERAHVVVEAVKIGLRDRDDHLSDPDAMTHRRNRPLRRRVDRARVATASTRTRASVPAPGHPQRGGTAYLCAADDGLLVSLIQSNFLSFGSGVHVPEWGINLNNRGSSFALDASRVNALAPSKLPMHTLIPAMVLRDRRPELVFGSMGGDAQAQVHAQVLTAVIDDGADPQAAIDAPRWRVEPWDWRVRVEADLDPDVVQALGAARASAGGGRGA